MTMQQFFMDVLGSKMHVGRGKVERVLCIGYLKSYLLGPLTDFLSFWCQFPLLFPTSVSELHVPMVPQKINT